MATLAAQVSATGIIAPSYPDILQQLKSQFWSIYGSDANLDDDTQDGQWIAVQAQAIFDCNQVAIKVYNSFSPATAQGAALSSVVKINGIARRPSTNSQAIVKVVGVQGTTIQNGLVGDNMNLKTQWSLPMTVVIPDSGEIEVTATCTTTGDNQAPIASLTEILTPTLGWQTVTNETAGTPGSPIESDAALRQRQTNSTALPAHTIIESIYGAIAAIPNVSKLYIYENDNDAADVNGIPGHSICLVVLGGDVQLIAETLALTKSPGTGTYGDIETFVIDTKGVPLLVKFFAMQEENIYLNVTIDAGFGYTDVIGEEIKQAIVDWINGLSIGEDVYYGKLWGPANLNNTPSGETFNVTDLRVGTAPVPVGQVNIVIPFTSNALCSVDNINLIVT